MLPAIIPTEKRNRRINRNEGDPLERRESRESCERGSLDTAAKLDSSISWVGSFILCEIGFAGSQIFHFYANLEIMIPGENLKTAAARALSGEPHCHVRQLYGSLTGPCVKM